MFSTRLKSIIIVCFVLLSFFSISHFVEVTKAAPSFEVYDKVTICTGSSFYFPTVKMAHNGTLVCMYRVGHDGSALYWKVSHDNGTTWVPSGDGNKLSTHGGGLLAVCPNGDILARAAHGDDTYDIYRSEDNGTSFQFDYNLNDSTGNNNGVMRLDRYGFSYGNKVFLNYYDDDNGDTGYYIYATDNGSTNASWTLFGGGPVVSNNVDEFSMVPLHGNGTWRTVHRDYPFGWQYNVITHNNGTTWTSTGEDLPTAHNYAPWAFWIDDSTIICCLEYDNKDARIYESHNNMTSWNLVEEVLTGNSHYLHGCTMIKRPGDIGGWAFVVTADNSFDIVGWKVANNETLDWDWPPGYYDDEDDPPAENISITSINGETNNSILQEQNRSFNWTNISGAEYYQLQISNSSTFDTVFLNLTNINETNYGVNYTEIGDYVEFILPDQYNISYYGYHYYRVRAYT